MLQSSPRALRAIIAIVILFVIVESLLILTDKPTVVYFPGHHGGQAEVGVVNWSRFAYTQYVTNTAYLCNSVMLFETLHRLNSKPDRVMMYPSEFPLDGNNTEPESRLLRKARDEYNVKLVPIKVQSRGSPRDTWAASFTKLLAFNQTQYQRVLNLDSDSTVLQSLDELFLMPPCPLGLPRAYWLDPNERVQTSSLLLIQPSHFEFDRITTAINNASPSEHDMEIVNTLYKDSALIIPHRPWTLLTGEFRGENHTTYLGNDQEVWNPDEVASEAKFLHFSDWPVPKPWIEAPQEIIEKEQPRCRFNAKSGQKDDCRNRDYWLGFYADFAKRRADVCGYDT
ncbi:hypothetical protein PEX1_092410 [Penicillium expansum]|uniref:Glycosyl transferase, family 8 n=1 Tax=Penicillium expansum TaxID=27334 RepID=A0A0A2IYW8_PENEN|nr:hypothetical protein PEX2_064580 [Penicillium expansum]KGO47716.1 hypothetical protein PEXP_013650 [Penicillium expansum]KGO51996.1 hypothetical protein PEX2_064580 [Penicillium expansum]KGO73198.1 hypothetical protein PEX1_092410 [Penicillium expansum]